MTALQAQVTTLQSKVTALETQNADQRTAIDGFTTLLAGVSRSGNTLLISGMNLQVVNGSGSTDGPVNGLGNITNGYNANDGDTKTGSHNLVVGDWHTYTSTAGVVTGSAIICGFIAGGGTCYENPLERHPEGGSGNPAGAPQLASPLPRCSRSPRPGARPARRAVARDPSTLLRRPVGPGRPRRHVENLVMTNAFGVTPLQHLAAVYRLRCACIGPRGGVIINCS